MAKDLPIRIESIRKSGTLALPTIPINAYNTEFAAEVKRYGAATLVGVLRAMMVIREFETMLDGIKKVGEYQGIAYNHLGPAHLSIGQESAAVGQCLALANDDLIFGSHRSHGEIIAKCFSSIQTLPEKETQAILERYNGGVYTLIERRHPSDSLAELARRYVLYGLLAEIFARHNGFNNGLGGSMHAFFTPFGSMPNNAIVGGSADIAVGAALYKKVNRKRGIVIANIGDAAMACGPVWEALTFAAMDQYHTLWEQSGAPPYLLNVFNNFYGMGGQTVGETMGAEYVARIAAGVNRHALHAERVDGFNPLAVADAVRRKKELLLAGNGPALLDTITYRISGHSPSDASSYRTKEEIDEFTAHDAIPAYTQLLLDHNLLSQSDAQSMDDDIKRTMKKTLELVTDQTITPYVQASVIEQVMFSRKAHSGGGAAKQPQVVIPLGDNPRVKQLAKKNRYAYDKSGTPHPSITLYTLRDAIFEAVIHNAYTNPDMIIYGEENRDWGGAFACYRGLTESLPHHRLFNSPISEAAIVGSAVGYALSGGTALVELMYCDFLGRAGDEVFNQMPKWQAMSGGTLTMPLVLRISVGDKYGAQHSQDWTALVAHIPGLMVMYPATPYDAKGMLHYALTHDDPVVFVESQKIYGVGEQFYSEGVPREMYEIPLGQPALRTHGDDITIITLGPSLYRALEACATLSDRYGVSGELIDLRFVNPLDYETILTSVKKTGKVLLVGSATERGSFMHTVASHITEQAFAYLDAPPVVLGAQNWITPPAELEGAFFPNADAILDTIDQCLIPLAGHTPTTTQTAAEKMRRNMLRSVTTKERKEGGGRAPCAP